MEVKSKPSLHQDWIDSHAYGIVKALQKGGHQTFLVGGCVRDLLLGVHPKDFDIATMANPQQVKRLIYMSFIIGKRFRLVLVKRENQQFEVATFRRETRPEDLNDPNAPAGDNIFGTPEEDAQRRDFTINGLFYDPINEQLIDYVGGMKDIEARILRMIGTPSVRLIEDPIRILRGLRLAHKLGFTIEADLREAIKAHASELEKSVLPRRREEVLKILRLDEPDLALMECFDLGILKHVLPTLHDLLSEPARRELFLEHFNSLQASVTDPAETTQLFGWLTYAMLRAAGEAPSERTEPITIEDEIFQRFMRDELGMYKFEQTVVSKAIEMIPSLHRAEEFKKRGERRQLAFMKNEGFNLAFQLAVSDFQIFGEQIRFWREAHERLAEDLNFLKSEARAKRRRRPRRRKPGEARGGSTTGVDDSDDDDDDDGESGDDAEDRDAPSGPAPVR